MPGKKRELISFDCQKETFDKLWHRITELFELEKTLRYPDQNPLLRAVTLFARSYSKLHPRWH